MFIDKDLDPTIPGGFALIAGIIGMIATMVGLAVYLFDQFGFVAMAIGIGALLQIPLWFTVREFNRKVKLKVVNDAFDKARR